MRIALPDGGARRPRFSRACQYVVFSRLRGTKPIHDVTIGNICAKCNVDAVELLLDKKNIFPSLANCAEL
jgi:hypothetical protein